MKRLKKMWLCFCVALSMLAAFTVPALADGPGGTSPEPKIDSGFSVSVDGSGGITITPGKTVSLAGSDWKATLVDWIGDYKLLAQIILAVCAIIALVCFIISIAKLSTSSLEGSPMARHKAITSIAVSGIALVLFGGLSLVVGFFWNFLATMG